MSTLIIVTTVGPVVAAAMIAIASLTLQRHVRPVVFAPIALALLIALTACGGTDSSASTATSELNRGDPAAVNAAWVAAVRDNNREAATPLYDTGNAEGNAIDVRNHLSSMASNIYPSDPAKAPLGAFQTVEVLDVRDVGAAKRAYSKWIFANETRCYYAELAQADGLWSVAVWGRTITRGDCGL